MKKSNFVPAVVLNASAQLLFLGLAFDQNPNGPFFIQPFAAAIVITWVLVFILRLVQKQRSYQLN
jgi:hypothetical protein